MNNSEKDVNRAGGRFRGKVALVVGSAHGIGAATARGLAREGANVVLGDINVAGAEEVAAGIRAAGGDAFAFPMDIAEERDVKALVMEAVKRYGGVDILANVAADTRPEVIGRDSETDILKLDLGVYDRTMAVNVRGFLLTMKFAVPEMLKRGGGAIVNTSSMAGLAPEPLRGAYAVSKSAINMLTAHVATAYGKQGIRCNAVSPGATIAPDVDPAQHPFFAMLLRHQPTPGLSRYEDQANVILFLVSDEAKFINGTVVRVDGGTLTPLASYADFLAGAPALPGKDCWKAAAKD